MTKSSLLQQISELKGALALVEADLKTKVPGAAVLDEFRGVVDSTRKSVWTVLNAMSEDDYDQYVADFRLRRAADTLNTVLADIRAGITPEHKNAEALRATMENVVNAGKLTRLSNSGSDQ